MSKRVRRQQDVTSLRNIIHFFVRDFDDVVWIEMFS